MSDLTLLPEGDGMYMGIGVIYVLSVASVMTLIGKLSSWENVAKGHYRRFQK